MPVPRLYEAPSQPRDVWMHVLATLLALGTPETREAMMSEMTGGESLPGVTEMNVREARPLGDSGVVADITCRPADGAWTVAFFGTLAFDVDDSAAVEALAGALAETADRVIIVVISPDRQPPPAVTAASGDVRHRSWQRVRDWIQERPERGGATGTDLLLLREAEYYFTSSVADLYRLEESAMPAVEPALRPDLAAAYFDLIDIAPNPRVETTGDEVVVHYPRTGDPIVSLAARSGTLEARVTGGAEAPGVEVSDGRATLRMSGPGDYLTLRGWLLSEARRLLPPRR